MITIKANAQTKRVFIRISKALQQHETVLEESLHDIAQDVLEETTRLIESPPKTGIHHPGLPNRSSTPGEAPATQSGRLAKSGEYRVRNSREMSVGERKIESVPDGDYPKYLENGTKKMKARPHLIKAIQNKSQDGVNTILTNVDREINSIP